jgi:hypothetical protein
MKIDINGNKCDLSAMLISCTRYALGRKTYIVSWTCDFIANNLHLLIVKDAKTIVNDILEHEKTFGLGDDCDVRDWHKLLNSLELYIQKSKE